MAFAALPALAIGALGAATSLTSARQQNRAIEKSMGSQVDSLDATQKQLNDAASLEKLKAKRAAAQVDGRLRVAAGEAGVGLGGTYTALLNQNAYDEALNQSVIDRNYANELSRARSGFRANVAQLGAGVRTPLLDAFTGGLSGFSSGLQITGAIGDYNRLQQTPIPDPYQPVAPPTINA